VTVVNVELLQSCSSRPDREGRDRLEIMTALIDGPSFDAMFRPDVIDAPPEHPIYRWVWIVDGCQRPGSGSGDLCGEHEIQWSRERARGVGKAAFLSAATGLPRFVRFEDTPCRICPDRPIAQSELLLCRSHQMRWFRYQQSVGEAAQFDEWLNSQSPLPGYGTCVVAVCLSRAHAPLGLCARHDARYDRDGRPGGAMLPVRWWNRYERIGEPVPIDYTDEQAFRRWCATTSAPPGGGRINLLGLRPLVAAEIKWGVFVHARRARPQRWQLGWLRSLVTTGRDLNLDSLVGLQPDISGCPQMAGAIAKEIQRELRLVYYTPADTRDAGFIETDHFEIRFPGQPFRPHRHPATLAAGSGLGSPDRACCSRRSRPAPAASSTQPAGPQRNWASSWRTMHPRAGTTRGCSTVSTCAGSSPTNAAANATAWHRWR
jgi:hypothetical protein